MLHPAYPATCDPAHLVFTQNYRQDLQDRKRHPITTQLAKFVSRKSLIDIQSLNMFLEKRLITLSKCIKIQNIVLEYHSQRNQKAKLIKSLAILLNSTTSIQESSNQELHHEESRNICQSLFAKAKRG